MNPVGPLPSRVYWLRRAIVIAVAVVVLIGLVWFAVSKVTGGSGSADPNAAGAEVSSSADESTEALTGVLATTSDDAAASAADPSDTAESDPPAKSTDKSADKSTAKKTTAKKTQDTATAAAPVRTTTPAPKSTPDKKAAQKKAAQKKAAQKKAAQKKAAEKKAAQKKAAEQNSAEKKTAEQQAAEAKAAEQAAADQAAAEKAAAEKAAAEKAAAEKAAAEKAAAEKAAAEKAAAEKAAAEKKKAEEAKKPKTDDQGRLLCTDAAITLGSTVGSPSYTSGSKPILGLTVTNSSSTPCVRDVSGTLQVFTVFAADGTRIWSTEDCFPGEGTDVRQLQPGESLQYNIRWSGTTSAPGCAGERVAVGPGEYQVVAQLEGLKATPAKFTVG